MNNMNIQKEKQEQWCITDLFYMTKSYEQILEDHCLFLISVDGFLFH